jgi:hypothetical protein
MDIFLYVNNCSYGSTQSIEVMFVTFMQMESLKLRSRWVNSAIYNTCCVCVCVCVCVFARKGYVSIWKCRMSTIADTAFQLGVSNLIWNQITNIFQNCVRTMFSYVKNFIYDDCVKVLRLYLTNFVWVRSFTLLAIIRRFWLLNYCKLSEKYI